MSPPSPHVATSRPLKSAHKFPPPEDWYLLTAVHSPQTPPCFSLFWGSSSVDRARRSQRRGRRFEPGLLHQFRGVKRVAGGGKRKAESEKRIGGGGGIRTPGRRKPSSDFKSDAFNHSATPPSASARMRKHERCETRENFSSTSESIADFQAGLFLLETSSRQAGLEGFPAVFDV